MTLSVLLPCAKALAIMGLLVGCARAALGALELGWNPVRWMKKCVAVLAALLAAAWDNLGLKARERKNAFRAQLSAFLSLGASKKICFLSRLGGFYTWARRGCKSEASVPIAQ